MSLNDNHFLIQAQFNTHSMEWCFSVVALHASLTELSVSFLATVTTEKNLIIMNFIHHSNPFQKFRRENQQTGKKRYNNFFIDDHTKPAKSFSMFFTCHVYQRIATASWPQYNVHSSNDWQILFYYHFCIIIAYRIVQFKNKINSCHSWTYHQAILF